MFSLCCWSCSVGSEGDGYRGRGLGSAFGRSLTRFGSVSVLLRGFGRSVLSGAFAFGGASVAELFRALSDLSFLRFIMSYKNDLGRRCCGRRKHE